MFFVSKDEMFTPEDELYWADGKCEHRNFQFTIWEFYYFCSAWWTNEWFLYLLVATRAVMCGKLLDALSSWLDFSGWIGGSILQDGWLTPATCVKVHWGVW